MLAALAVGMVNNMAQEWWSDSEVVLPAQEARQGVVIPAKPKEPDLPSPTRATEKWRPATAEEKQRYGVDPARAYQINDAGEIKEVSGQPTAKPEAQPDTNRVPQINTGLNAVKDLRKISEQFLSVGKQAGRLADAPIIGGLIGQNRADLEGSLEILKGIIIQDQLARLAKINPAGIASLANTPAEQERFVSSIANLDPNQSPEQFAIGLKRAEDYLNRQLSEASGGQVQTADAPSAGGGEGGPAVTVTTEESIAEFGFPAYDKAGNLVGRAYAQSGADTVYDAQGNEVGIIRGVPEQTVEEPAPSFFGGIVRDIGEAVTGSERATATTEGLPDWVEMPEMQQLFSIPAFKAALGTAFGGGPKEIAQIVQSNFPGTEVFQDEKGNYILRSPSTGQRYAIKPGFQLSDVPRALSILLTGAGGRGAGVAQTALREGALQTGIEATQRSVGGTFNPEDVATAAVIGGGGQKLAEVLPGVVQGVRNVRTGRAAPEMAVQGAPELPGGLTRPNDVVTPQPAQTAPAAEIGAPIPTGEARVFEAGETVGGRGTAGAMSASEETIRAQRAAELPVPIELARFQRTRNFAEQQRARELAKNNEVGGPIRDRMSQQQDALRQNFERFIEGTGSQVWENPYEQGGVIADALSTLAKRERTKINALYKRAEQAGEMREPVSYRSLSDFIASQTPTTREKLAPVLRTVQEQLDAADPNKTGMITLNQMEDIRKLINKVASPGTPDASFGRDMRGIIDDATKDAGGDVYRQARSARAKYARDFDDIDLVQKIYSTKPGSTERYVALEKVVDRITGTSAPLDSVNSLLSLLDRAGPRGARAKKELQGAVMEKIRDQAYRGITRDESGGVVIQPAALNSIIVQLDKSGKLDAIFDKKTAELLRTVNDVTKDIVTAPPGSVNASGTSSAIMNAIDTVATFGTTGIPVPAAKILNEFRKALANRAMRKEVKRLLD